MRSGIETLGLAELSELSVVYPGREEYPLAESVVVRPLKAFGE